MSSYNDPPQYNVDPSAPQPPHPPRQPHYGPPAQQPPYGQPPVQPYVEHPPHQGAAGGRPPYPPPGGYTPMPPPPPEPRKRGRVLIASILSVALLLGIGAFVFFQFVWTTGPDPAERFPASAGMYVEVNLDPSFDQTPKLLEHLSKFEGLDYSDTDDLFADLIEESGLEGVEAERDLTSWLGRRHGFALWQHDDQPYGVINLASTDAAAAEAGIERIRDASGATAEEWAYTVNDDSVLMVVGEGGAADALAAAESEADASPLSDASGYDEARSWLDGDQLLVYWLDTDALFEMGELMGDEEELESLSSMYSGHAVMGVAAFDEGFELSYRAFGEQDDPWTGSDDLMDNMGQMPAADLAVTADVPENLDEITEEWIDTLEGETGSSGEADAEPGRAEGEGPLTAEEYDEYLELDEQWWNDELAAEDEARYEELESRYWEYGTEEEPWVYEEDDYGSEFDDMFGEAEELIGLLSGAQLSLAADFPADRAEFDPETLFFQALLAEDRAEELEQLITEAAGDEQLPDGVEVDGSELTYQGGNVAEGTLAEDPRFADFAAAAPGSIALAAWADLSGLGEYEGAHQAEPLSAFAWAHGTVDGDGTGLARLYLK
ncbi:hypothetical protein GCM10027447_02720 [Glycomyces halotolerans]